MKEKPKAGDGVKRYSNRYYPYPVMTTQIPLNDGKRDTILQWIYDIHIVEWYVTFLLQRYLDYDDVEDKCQEIHRMLAEKKQEDWDKLYEQGYYAVSAYVAGLIHKQIRSVSSFLYKNYERYKEIMTRQDEDFWTNYADSH